MSRNKPNLKKQILQKAMTLLDTKMPKNTNWQSFAARKRAASLIVDMVFQKCRVDKKRLKYSYKKESILDQKKIFGTTR